ncbi:MAG: ABC transporter substrate-binding protein [Oscillospiraceae bacterium]
MKKSKLLSLALAGILALAMTACGNANSTPDGGEITTSEITEPAETEVIETELETEETTAESEAANADSVFDREGNLVDVPAEINSIISAAPSVTEILTGLGLADKIIAADIYSADVEGIDPSVCTLDFYNLNTEELVALAPDVIIINGISETGTADPYADLKAAGTNVVYIPSAVSLDGIKDDIAFLAAYTRTSDKGAELISTIDSCISDISAKAANITEKKSVYFEISAAPYLYTTGSGTFLNEIIELVGAENIYGSESGWLSNSDETVIAGNPDVIITSVAYDGYDFNEITARAGWDVLTAVKNGAVYQVGANETSRASQHIVDGINEIASAIYPDVYGENANVNVCAAADLAA